MKRQLTAEETDIYKKQIKRLEHEIIELDEAIDMQELNRVYTEKKWEYEDKIIPYNRKVQMIAIKQELAMTKEKKKQTENNIEIMKKHLIEGVDIKEKKE